VANIKSAKKRVLITRKKRERNFIVRSMVKNILKKYDLAIKSGQSDNAKLALSKAMSILDKAAKKGVLHKNTAARKKSRLAKKLNTSLV